MTTSDPRVAAARAAACCDEHAQYARQQRLPYCTACIANMLRAADAVGAPSEEAMSSAIRAVADSFLKEKPGGGIHLETMRRALTAATPHLFAAQAQDVARLREAYQQQVAHTDVVRSEYQAMLATADANAATLRQQLAEAREAVESARVVVADTVDYDHWEHDQTLALQQLTYALRALGGTP